MRDNKKMKASTLFDNQRFVQTYAKKLSLDQVEQAIFCFSSSSAKKISLTQPVQTSFCLGARFDIYKDFKTVIVSQFGYGASAAALQLEYLSALGIKRFYCLGMACSLSEEQAVAQMVLINKAYPSLHKSNLEDSNSNKSSLEDSNSNKSILKTSSSNKSIDFFKENFIDQSQCKDTQKLAQDFDVSCVTSLSSLFPFQEQKADYQLYRSQKISVLEMEAYYLMSLAKQKDLKLFCFCCLSDFVTQDSWQTHFSNKNLQKQTSLFLENLLLKSHHLAK